MNHEKFNYSGIHLNEIHYNIPLRKPRPSIFMIIFYLVIRLSSIIYELKNFHYVKFLYKKTDDFLFYNKNYSGLKNDIFK
jgi:hypothetical protein